MLPGVTFNGNFGCDMCCKPLNVGAHVYSCRFCNFDVCETHGRQLGCRAAAVSFYNPSKWRLALEVSQKVRYGDALAVAAETGRHRVVTWLMRLGMDEALVNKGNPLVLACSGGHEAVVKVLLAHGAIDVNQATLDMGRTPLYVACQQGHAPVVELLLAHPAIDVNIRLSVATWGASGRTRMLVNNGETPLTVASKYGHADVVKLLLAHSAINVDLGKNETPLLMASMHGWATVVQQLLDKGADTSVQDCNGWTALKTADRFDQRRVVGVLLDAGAGGGYWDCVASVDGSVRGGVCGGYWDRLYTMCM